MYSRRPRNAIKAAALALAVVLAPAAVQAGELEVSRNTGVGEQIAAQGNRALQAIREEAVAAVREALPQLPKKARVVKMSQPSGSTLATGADVQCAE